MHIWSGKSDLYYYYYYFQKKENKMYQFCLHFMVLLQSDLTSKHQHEGSVRTKLSASEARWYLLCGVEYSPLNIEARGLKTYIFGVYFRKNWYLFPAAGGDTTKKRTKGIKHTLIFYFLFTRNLTPPSPARSTPPSLGGGLIIVHG